MGKFTLTHLTDETLLGDLAALIKLDRATIASFLACIAEVDARRLYLPAGYPSMYAYCLEELRLSEDAAYKRIQAARAARQFPALFPALADGRLHLTAACLLAPHLTPENADELIAEATHQTKSGIELVLAHRFPRAEALRLDEGISALARLAPAQVAAPVPGQVVTAPGMIPDNSPVLAQVAPPALRDKVAPIAPQRFALQVTIASSTHDKLRRAQALLGHSVPSGEIALVLDRALDALIGQLEKRKCASTPRPRRASRPTAARRTIPAHVRRAVWERDQGRCTFVSSSGRRCAAIRGLEFDHIDPVARGGVATVDRMRLRCRAHNQYEAERAFGADFMQQKREQARQAAHARRSAAPAGRIEERLRSPSGSP